MNKQYLAYIRVSTVKQVEGASLKAQKDAIERYAASNGYNIAQWFEEKETAAKQGRPLFTRMVKLLHAGKAQGVIMHKIDRSARNFRDWATIGELHDSGIEVHFANENVDFTSRGGRLSADIQAVFAADYIRNLKEETAKGQEGRLKEGLYPWSAPMGYLDMGKGKPKAIDPVTGPYVQLMFELYATGQHSFVSLQKELYARGVRSKNNKTVYVGKIEEILANPFYMGLIHIKRTGKTYTGQHEALISPELFNKVQEIKQSRSRRKKTKHNHLYRGLFHCAQCENSMTPERQKGHVYYRCHTKTCPSNCIRGRLIEEAVVSKLSQFKIAPAQLKQFHQYLAQWLTHLPKAPSQDIHAMEQTKIEGAKDRLTDALMNGTIDEATYKKKVLGLDFRQMEISKAHENQKTREEKGRFAGVFLEHAKNLAQTYFFATDSEKRQMLDLCFSNMSVFDKSPLLQTRNWLSEALDFQLTPFCADYRGENRSCPDLGELEIQGIIDGLDCQEAQQLVELCSKIEDRQRHDQLPEPAIDGVLN